MRRKLRGKAILLTGASRGIGRCTAERLGREGARLVVTARSNIELEELASQLRSAGVEAHALPADLTSPSERERLVRTTVEMLGGLDVLVNNAGLCSFGEFATSSEDILRRIMEINFFAPVELIRLCLPHLTASHNRPAVVNVTSICGRRGIPSFPEHCASKFALVGLTEALRGELARFGVDVVLVVPGLVRPDDFERHLLRDEGRIYLNWAGAQAPDKVARGIVRALRKGWYETVVGWTALQVHRANRFFPWLMDWILARKVRRFEKRSAMSIVQSAESPVPSEEGTRDEVRVGR
jgi:short-subunit dehydrogenase